MRFEYLYEDQYLVKLADDMTHGTLKVNYEMAPQGATITITPQPEKGYMLSNIWYIRKDHGTGANDFDHVEGSNEYTIAMPPSQFTLHAEFQKITYPNHTHDDETVFLPCIYNSVLSEPGSYYLIEDTELSAEALSSGTLNICLMGHTLTITGDGYTVASGATLSIFDDTGKGAVTGNTINVNGTLNMYAGHFKGFTGGAVAVANGGTFNIHGGRITDNTSPNHGAGVYVATGGDLNIYGDVTIHMNSMTVDENNMTDDNVYLEPGAVINIAGTTIVYLTKTSIRHYYTVTDQDKFDAVKNGITFNGEKAEYFSKDGKIYFELTDVAAADLDTQYTLTIGETGYSYSVLDYVRECLSAPNAPYATKQLVSATYWYNRAADGYFDNQEE